MTDTNKTASPSTSSPPRPKAKQQPFLEALKLHCVAASVMHLDHYRVGGGVSIRTDYIILVQHVNHHVNDSDDAADRFEAFMISKRYHAFRVFVDDLQAAAAEFGKKLKQSGNGGTTAASSILVRYCEAVENLVESQPKQYLNRVIDSVFFKKLARQRSEIINSVLQTTLTHYPNLSTIANNKIDKQTEENNKELASASSWFVQEVERLIQTFFLTDVCSVEAALHYKDKEGAKPTMTTTTTTSKHNNPFKQFVLPKPLAGFAGGEKDNKKPRGGDDDDNKTSGRDHRNTIVPLTMRDRRSSENRRLDEQDIFQSVNDGSGDEAKKNIFVVEDTPPLRRPRDAPDTEGVVRAHVGASATNYPKKTMMSMSAFGDLSNPYLYISLVLMALVLIARASYMDIRLPGDLELLMLFAAYCLGLHTPRSTSYFDAVTTAREFAPKDPAGQALMRRTLLKGNGCRRVSLIEQTMRRISVRDMKQSSALEDVLPTEYNPAFDYNESGMPMTEFPEGAELGTVTNCWGKSRHDDFKVRGANYLNDRIKVPSGDFVFPLRGCELLLTDTCPANVGRNPRLFSGKLRDVPTFIINFRLPWGVMLCYSEIPAKYVPYVKACYEKDSVSQADKAQLVAALADMTPGERTACRFLMNDTEHKNKTFKIVPVVVQGPWVVRQVVVGKPAVVGTKLPIDYVYSPEQTTPDGKKLCLYLEADLDIAASSAARGILSVVRSYTNVLTLDLGFVVQGNTEDELPEQMMIGIRLHGADPLTAPAYPEIFDEPEDIGLSPSNLPATGAGSSSSEAGSS